MGYTHYWEPLAPMSSKTWGELVDASQAIVKQTSVELADGLGEGRPDIGSSLEISLNGPSHDDLAHESFVLSPTSTGFNFCKTAGKPYDVVVTAILTVAEHLTGGAFNVCSDGDAADWLAGVQLASHATGIALDVPKGVRDRE